jgi:hypothetical protein
MAKAWIVTLQSSNSANDTKVIDQINGRKKIGFVDTYLCDLYNELFPDTIPPAELKASISHPTGTQVILNTPSVRLFASLTEISSEN